MTARRLVILDRDGVLNVDSTDYIRSVAEWRPIAGSMEALGRLTKAGCTLAVATNQSGIGRGYFPRATLYGMHRKLRREAAKFGGRIATIEYCPHLPSAGCACRKPQPKLLVDIMQRLNMDPAETIMVGDSQKDLEAAIAAGVEPVLVLSGKTLSADGLAVDRVYPDLAAFAADEIQRC